MSSETVDLSGFVEIKVTALRKNRALCSSKCRFSHSIAGYCELPLVYAGKLNTKIVISEHRDDSGNVLFQRSEACLEISKIKFLKPQGD